MGAPRSTPRRLPPDGDLRDALSRILADAASLRELEREALAAWLCAWRSHWPTSFEDRLAPEGRDALARLDLPKLDRGRHIKLRRIALANLAGAL